MAVTLKEGDWGVTESGHIVGPFIKCKNGFALLNISGQYVGFWAVDGTEPYPPWSINRAIPAEIMRAVLDGRMEKHWNEMKAISQSEGVALFDEPAP